MIEKMKNLSKNRFLTLVITLCLSAVLFLSGFIVFLVDRGNEQGGDPDGNTRTTMYLGNNYQLENHDNAFKFTPNVSRTYTFTISGYSKTVYEFVVSNNGSTTYSSTGNYSSYSVYLSYGITYEIDIEMYVSSSGYATLNVSAN